MDIRSYFIKGSVGIHIQLEETQAEKYSLCLLSRKNNTVTVSNLAAATSVEQIDIEAIPSGSNVNLAISGKGVLTKSITTSEQRLPDDEVVTTLFPNIDPEKIYYSIYRTTVATNISIIKKEIIDGLLEKLHSKNLFFSDIYIGPYTASFLAPLLEKNKSINAGGTTLTITEDNETIISNSTANEDKLLVGDEEIKPEFHLAYAGAIGYYLPNPSFSTSGTGSIQESRGQFGHKLFFKKTFVPSLVIFFILALLNFVFYYIQETKNKELVSAYNYKKSGIEKIDLYTKEIEKNSVLLSSLNLEDQQIYAFFLDRLADNKPSGITWYTVEINPVVESNKSFDIKGRTILITGKANDASSLNQWINEIKKFDWLDGIAKQNYIYDLTNKVGEFELELSYNLNLQEP